MGTKEKLIEKISNIENESLLVEIMEMVDLELELIGPEVQLTEQQKNMIDEGLKDLESGNMLSSEEARVMTREWLKRK